MEKDNGVKDTSQDDEGPDATYHEYEDGAPGQGGPQGGPEGGPQGGMHEGDTDG